MRRRGLHRVTGTAVLLAVLALLTSVSTASADVVHLKIKEGRTVLDPGTNTVIAGQNAIVSTPYTWLLSPRRDRHTGRLHGRLPPRRRAWPCRPTS